VSDDLDQPEQDGYELVLPFVVCASVGGPYEDQAFVAGYQAGQVDRALATVAAVGGLGLKVTVYAALAKQLDLIAMKHGFVSTTEAVGDPGFVTDDDPTWITWSCSR